MDGLGRSETHPLKGLRMKELINCELTRREIYIGGLRSCVAVCVCTE